MRRFALLISAVGTLALTSCGGTRSLTSTVETGEPGARMHLFLLIGQSNMAGRGVVAEADSVIHPRVFAWNAEGKWVPAVDPVHFDKPIAGVGPGRTFGLEVANAEPSIRVGLIPAAVGGSPISTWRPGIQYPETKSYPYDDAVTRAKAATNDGKLKAILWHQGESDSHEGLAPLYKEELIALIGRLRNEFDDPNLPFLIGQLGEFDDKPWDEWKIMVNGAHNELAQEIPGVYFVNSEGLTDKGDDVHFSAASARELGRRFARVYRFLSR